MTTAAVVPTFAMPGLPYAPLGVVAVALVALCWILPRLDGPRA